MPGANFLRDSSASVSATPSSLQDEEAQFQTVTKEKMERELSGATFYVDLISEGGILHPNPEVVDKVMRDLQGIFHTLVSNSKIVSTPSNPRFPDKGFSKEKKSYAPFAHLLNKIIKTANQHISIPSLLRELFFHPFDGQVNDTYGSYKGLKPDGVGIFSELTPAELSWDRIEVTFEARTSIPDMIRQSGTYARFCLLSNHRRSFAFVIAFQHKTLEAYIFVYHRSGLSSSRALDLRTHGGRKGLVSHMVGILSIKDGATYGLDTTRNQNTFCINNRYYKILCHVYVRNCLRGRCTIVDSLQGKYTCRLRVTDVLFIA